MFDASLYIIFLFSLIIHILLSLAYSIRLAGVESKNLALSFSLFNNLNLLIRFSFLLVLPLLARKIENYINYHTPLDLELEIRLYLLACFLGSVLGIILMPILKVFFISILKKAQLEKNFLFLVYQIFTINGLKKLKSFDLLIDSSFYKINKSLFFKYKKTFFLLILTNGLYTVSFFATSFAAFQDPNNRMTINNLSAILTGFSTIAIAIFIDPLISVLSDDASKNSISNKEFEQFVFLVSIFKLLGIILAQFLLWPAAMFINLIVR